ncbi:MAG: TRAM domain-containing protein [Planctomycetia bacterium]|nr:TRAM domain-containing protein [Planctomycetia bacterium]
MPLLVLRILFLVVAAGLGVRLIQPATLGNTPAWVPWVVFFGVLLVALLTIVFDVIFSRKHLDLITAVYFGLLIGLFLTYVLRLALSPLLPENIATSPRAVQVMAILGMVLCYVCISVLLQTRDDFRFIIPYVEFSKEIKGLKPYVLDTSVVIDGRIADVVETEIFDSQLIMPRFIVNELQAIADSSDRLRRTRGRRGLDILNRLRNNPKVDLQVMDREPAELAGQSVDLKLVLLAKNLNAKVVTNDYNLNKVARLHGVGVVNLNDLANALKPVFLPGETIDVRVVKAGEEPGQGVGYLDDGTMIVIEGGREYINRDVHITVTSVLQTSAGRMVFGKCESPV